jgi:hypothetical protein
LIAQAPAETGFGIGFRSENDQVALKVAATDGGGWKINQLSATSSDPDHVRPLRRRAASDMGAW